MNEGGCNAGLITDSPLPGSPDTKNLPPGHPLPGLGQSVTGSEKGERGAHWPRQVGGRRLPALPHCLLHVLCICPESDKQLGQNQIPSKRSQWKTEGKTFAPYLPYILPHPLCPSSWDMPGSQESPSSRRHRCHLGSRAPQGTSSAHPT